MLLIPKISHLMLLCIDFLLCKKKKKTTFELSSLMSKENTRRHFLVLNLRFLKKRDFLFFLNGKHYPIFKNPIIIFDISIDLFEEALRRKGGMNFASIIGFCNTFLIRPE